jgi:hypothetical protein
MGSIGKEPLRSSRRDGRRQEWQGQARLVPGAAATTRAGHGAPIPQQAALAPKRKFSAREDKHK